MHKKAYTMAQVHKNSLFASPRSCTAVSRPGSAPDPPGKAPWTRSTRPPRLCRNNVWKKITWAYSPALEVAAIVEYTHNTLCKLDIWDLFSVTVIYDYFDKWRLFKHIFSPNLIFSWVMLRGSIFERYVPASVWGMEAFLFVKLSVQNCLWRL